MSSMHLEDNHFCFACGMENMDGLRINWKVDGKKTFAEFTPQKKHQGWKGILHGGITATLLDEAMTRLSWLACGGALTAEMTVRYILPAKIGEKLYIEGEIINENKKIVEMKASIHKENFGGPLVAHSSGKAVKIKP